MFTRFYIPTLYVKALHGSFDCRVSLLRLTTLSYQDAVASAFPISGFLQPFVCLTLFCTSSVTNVLLLPADRLGSIIISRFILNLRQANQPFEDTSDTAGWSTSRFNSHIFVGNLGESLVFGDTDDSDDSDVVTMSARQDSPSIESYQHRDNDIDGVGVRMS